MKPNLADPDQLKSYLNRHGLWARKSLGQHFLIDEQVLDAIVSAIETDDDESIIEVGPGPGVLSQRLVEQGRQLIAVEIDDDYIKPWMSLMESVSHAQIIHQDVLEYEPPTDPYLVIANIPYYITSAILRHFLITHSDRRPRAMVFLIQKEVAQRICDQKKPTLLSWMVRVYAEPEIVTLVPGSAFFPPPKVDSAVISLRCYEVPLVPEEMIEDVFVVMERCYQQPRKTLLNNLLSGSTESKEVILAQLEAAGVDGGKRPHQLSLDEWKTLTANVLKDS